MRRDTLLSSLFDFPLRPPTFLKVRKTFYHLLELDSVVPNLEDGLSRILGHMLPVRLNRPTDRTFAFFGVKAGRSTRDFDAGSQPLDVPFPRCGKRLVEIIDIKDDVTLGSCERAEVHDVTIAAGLNSYPGG